MNRSIKSFLHGVNRSLVLLAWMFPMTPLWAPDVENNCVANPEFEESIENWRYVSTPERTEGGTSPQPVVLPNVLSWEQKDTGGGSQGSLKVVMPPVAKHTQYTHSTGTVCVLASLLKGNQDAPIALRVYFAAKSLSGSRYLHVTRFGGNEEGQTVELSTDWKPYKVEFRIFHVTRELIFSLVKAPATDSSAVVDTGSFLLDFVQVEER